MLESLLIVINFFLPLHIRVYDHLRSSTYVQKYSFYNETNFITDNEVPVLNIFLKLLQLLRDTAPSSNTQFSLYWRFSVYYLQYVFFFKLNLNCFKFFVFLWMLNQKIAIVTCNVYIYRASYKNIHYVKYLFDIVHNT